MKLRIADIADGAQILAIYSPYILQSAATFENEVPTVSEFQNRMHHYLENYPWLVSVENNKITGYAYASKHRERYAYQWSVESSVYIHPDHQRGGTASKLYMALFALLRYQGFYKVYAGITLPNIPSESFHRKIGFTDIGIYRKIGFKLNQWQDVKWMGLTLNEYPENPEAPVPFHIIREEKYVQEILSK